jgi:hypothetical protein
MDFGGRRPVPRMRRAVVANMILGLAIAGCGSVTPASSGSTERPAPTSTATSITTPAPPVSAPTPPPASAPTPTPAPAPTATPIEPTLAAAIAFAGDDTRLLAFTSWAAVLDGRDTTADQVRVLLEINKTRAFPAAALLPRAAQLRGTWAFEMGDLAWEADLDGSRGQFTVLQFADSTDLSPVVALLDQRGYAHAAQVGDGTVYTHPLDPADEWLTKGPLQMLNVAVFPSARRIVMGTSPDALAAVVRAADPTASPAPGSKTAELRTLAATLGTPYGALFAVEVGACRSFAGGPVLATPAASSTEPPANARVSATLGTAIGFSAVTGAPPVTAALLYPDVAAAAADVPGRTALAAAAISVTGAPYAAAVMGLSNVRTVGSVLVLDGVPRDGRPQLVVNAWSRRDLPFAACP